MITGRNVVAIKELAAIIVGLVKAKGKVRGREKVKPEPSAFQFIPHQACHLVVNLHLGRWHKMNAQTILAEILTTPSPETLGKSLHSAPLHEHVRILSVGIGDLPE